MMAGDSATDDDGLRGQSTKVFKVDGHIVGFAGSLTEGVKFVAWYATREGDKPTLNDSEALVLRRDGKIEYWDEAMHPAILRNKFSAIGSGAAAALAAMHCGKTPDEAVRIACKVDACTGLPIKCLKR